MSVEERAKQDLKVSEEEQSEIRRKIGELQNRQAFLVEHIKRIREVLGDPLPALNPRQKTLIAGAPAPFQGMKIMDAIVRILQQNGGKMRVEGIVDAAISGGLRDAETEVEREKVRNNISSILYHAAKEPDSPIIRDPDERGHFKLRQTTQE